MAFQPRRAKKADAANVLKLTRQAYAKWVPAIGREPLPMTTDYDRAVLEHIIDLWEEGGQLVGLIETIPKETYLLIENIAVRPDQQGNGIGKELLHHAEKLARSLGLAEMRLYTNAAFGSNVAYYVRHGYEEFLREVTIPGNITVHMSKRLH